MNLGGWRRLTCVTDRLHHLDAWRTAPYDAVIVGGGPAGLSAALVLGRARKRVLVVDDERPANAVSQGVGGLLGHDRVKPADLRESGRRPDCYLQVNIGDEPQKGGCAIADLPALLDAARAADLPVAGLMCLSPADVEPAPYFALLAKLARRHGVTGLSMGMSADYKAAVMLGATAVRVGTALFD